MMKIKKKGSLNKENSFMQAVIQYKVATENVLKLGAKQVTIVISSVLLMSKQETSRILDPLQSAADSNQVMAPHVEPPKDSHVPKLAISSVVQALVPRPVMPGSSGTAYCVPVVLWGMLL